MSMFAAAGGRDVVPSALNWADFAAGGPPTFVYNANQTLAGLGTGISINLVVNHALTNYGAGDIIPAAFAYDKNSGGAVDCPDGTVISVTNGDTLRFGAYDGSDSGFGLMTITGTVTVSNASSGSTVLDTFAVT